MKAVKNQAEIDGARAAQLRDGAAVTRFLAWFDRTAARGELTEIAAVEALESFRRESGLLKDISFPTIAGAGPNGAIVHYRVTRKTNRRIGTDDLFCSIPAANTKTAPPTSRARLQSGCRPPRCGAISRWCSRAISRLRARCSPTAPPARSSTRLARQFLWQAGLDFDHGTGHGVGSYLSVHEGPARISKLGVAPLKRGMILSNEPGYYRADAYGIRIENLVLVTQAPDVPGAEKPLNAFETLTLAPIDRAPGRPAHADRRRASPGSTLIRRACAKRSRRSSTPRRARGCSQRPAAAAKLEHDPAPTRLFPSLFHSLFAWFLFVRVCLVRGTSVRRWHCRAGLRQERGNHARDILIIVLILLLVGACRRGRIPAAGAIIPAAARASC